MIIYNRTILNTLNIKKITELGDNTHHITFKQFVQWITTPGAAHNHYFMSQYYACNICHRNYKYIVKTRTLPEDFNYLIHLTKMSQGLAQSNPENNIGGHNYVNNVVEAFSPSQNEKQINKVVHGYLKELGSEMLDKLVEKYQVDMNAFGYGVDRKKLWLTGLSD